MTEPNDLRALAEDHESRRDFETTRALRDAADEIEELRRRRAPAPPAPDVRLMHYRCAAMTGLLSSLAHGEIPTVDQGAEEPGCWAKGAEAIARAMLAAEGKAS